ncbi:hypothetical protein [Leptospira saintgironsiae]|uniref:Uncharacterized protein n=1 Tax=Leptospira saintgironsiae TaxID=2023183 RepID=A0A2M9YA88_9LEPT|nr:hypothetical protein [Leptospira saintgironsiae]PJZ48480.1 hypothetical protein CH362_14865 [Leptospira saintgironsiae]
MKNNFIVLIISFLIPFYLLFQPQSEASEIKNLKIHLRGLGSINLNDRIDQIEKKLSIKFVGGKEDSDFDGKPCYFYSIPDLKSVLFMFTGAANDIRLGRIYINDPSLETLSGIRIGSDVQSVLSKYKDNIQRSSEHYRMVQK